jgi:hypothetical protein
MEESKIDRLNFFLNDLTKLCNKHKIFIQFFSDEVYNLPNGKFVECFGFDKDYDDSLEKEDGVFFFIPKISSFDLDKLLGE